MNERVVVDASVVVKWFLPEPGSEAALTLRDELRAHRRALFAPELLQLEIGSVLGRRVSARILSFSQATSILAAIRADAFIRWAPVSALATSALAVAVEIGATVYDAAYVVLAEQADADFVTADQKLARRIEASPYRNRLRVLG